jgi:large subunit ribosomal protein L1
LGDFNKSLLPQHFMSDKIIKIKGRSKKYASNYTKIQTAKKTLNTEILSIVDAVDVLYDLDQPNFKAGTSIEIHFKLAINPTKSDQFTRGAVVLPHGTGKEVKIVAFVNPENVDKAKKLGVYKAGGEELIEEIKVSGKVDFDIAVAEPELMKKLPAIARLLGTAGVMPNPKTGTVGTNIEEMITLIKAGKVDFKNDKSANIHFGVGKLNKDFDKTKIVANIEAAIDAVEKAKPSVVKKYINSIHITTTMSPSIRIK